MVRRIAIILAIFASAFGPIQGAGMVEVRSVSAASVVTVQATRTADVVLLGAGFDAGLRQGMVFSVTRAGNKIAEIVLIDLRPRASAALIVQLTPGQQIRSGDTATVKTLKV